MCSELYYMGNKLFVPDTIDRLKTNKKEPSGTEYIFFVQKKKTKYLKMENSRWTQHAFYYYLWTVKLRTYATHALQILITYSITSNIHDSNTCTSQTTNMKVQLLYILSVQIDLFNNWSSVFCVLLEMPCQGTIKCRQLQK